MFLAITVERQTKITGGFWVYLEWHAFCFLNFWFMKSAMSNERQHGKRIANVSRTDPGRKSAY